MQWNFGLTREDVLGNRTRVFGVECKICDQRFFPLTICDGCANVYCDKHLIKHPDCDKNGSFDK